MANENELRIVFGGDTTPLKADTAEATNVVKKFGDAATKAGNQGAEGFERLKKSVQGIPKAFDEIAAGNAALARIHKSIDEAADAAIKAGRAFESFGRAPLQNIAGLDAELRKIKNTLASGFKPAIDKIGLSPANFSQIARTTDVVTNSTVKLKNASQAASLSVFDLGRIISDLPYGLRGVANNLTPAAEGLGRLSTAAGGPLGALKALGSSLLGPAGLIFAISAIPAVIQIAQDGFQTFGKKTKDTTNEFNEFLNAIRDSKRIAEDAAGSVDEEIIKVRTLAGVIGDVNASNTERTRALNELKNVNKEYFGDLSLESSALKNLTSITDEYTRALINQATAKGFADEVSKIAPELYKQQGILDQLKAKWKGLGEVTEQMKKNASGVGASYQDIQKIIEIGKAEQAFKDQRDLVENLEGELVGLKGKYQESIVAGLQFKSLDAFGGKEKETDALKERIATLEKLKNETGLLFTEEAKLAELRAQLINRDGLKLGFDKGQIVRQEGAIKAALEQEYASRFIDIKIPVNIIAAPKADSVSATLGKALPDGFNQPVIDKMVAAGQAAGQAYTDGVKEALGKRLANIITHAIGDVFIGFGELLGNALSGGGFAKAAEAFVGVIGGVLQQIGKQIILASALMAKLKAFLETAFTANPIAGIGIGLGLIAAGQLLKNIKFDVPKFAQGGLVTGPTLGLIGEAGPELIVPLNRADQFFEGGGGGTHLTGDFTVRGADLILALSRATQTKRRRGG